HQCHHHRGRPHGLCPRARLAAARMAGTMGRRARHAAHGAPRPVRRMPRAGVRGAARGRGLQRNGRVHRPRVLAVLPARRRLAHGAAHARAGSRATVPRAAVSADAARVLFRVRLHAVVQPLVRAWPGAGRLQRRMDRRGRPCPGRRGTAGPAPDRARRGGRSEEPPMKRLPASPGRRTALGTLLLLPYVARSEPIDFHLFPVPYVPTPMPVVRRMLELARVQPGELLYDLGCGDGRIVVEAAMAYGARGVGIDLDPARVAEAKDNARRAGVDDRVEIRQGDLFETDLSPADVVTLYLLPEVSLRLRPV